MSRCSPAPGKKDSTTPTAEPIDRGNFHGIAWSALEYTKHFVGVLCYLIRLHWLPQSRDYVGLSQPIPPDRTDRPPPPTKLFKDAFPYNGFPTRPKDLPGNVHRLRFFFDRGVPRPPSKTIHFNEIQQQTQKKININADMHNQQKKQITPGSHPKPSIEFH